MAFMPKIRDNSDALLRMGTGLLAGQTGSQQAALGLGGFADARASAREQQMAQQKQNQTIEWLRANAPELVGPVEAGVISAADAYNNKIKAQTSENASPTFGKTPVWGTDKDGNPALGVVGDDGSFKTLETPGFTPAAGFEKLDTGTDIVLRDKRTGQIVSVTPKNNYEESFAKGQGQAEGKAAGEAGASYESLGSKMAGLESVVSQLDDLAQKATYTYAGQGLDMARRQLGMEPREAAIARQQYIAMVDNQILPLLRDTFGAQFTEREGQSLKATLGAPNVSPQEKQQVLKAFIEQKKRDLQALGVQSGKTSNRFDAGSITPGNRTQSGVQWSIEP